MRIYSGLHLIKLLLFATTVATNILWHLVTVSHFLLYPVYSDGTFLLTDSFKLNLNILCSFRSIPQIAMVEVFGDIFALQKSTFYLSEGHNHLQRAGICKSCYRLTLKAADLQILVVYIRQKRKFQFNQLQFHILLLCMACILFVKSNRNHHGCM